MGILSSISSAVILFIAVSAIVAEAVKLVVIQLAQGQVV